MKRLFAVLILSLALAISLAPSLAPAAEQSEQDGLALAGATGNLAIPTMQTAKTPKISVKRAATGKVAIKVGRIYRLGAKATAGKLSYKSSNKKVVRVSSKGALRAMRAGKATIVITAKNGSKKAVKKVPVRVLSAKKYKAVKKIRVKAPVKSLKKGKTTKLKVTFAPSKASNKNVIYKSSNPKVLAVNAAGKVKAKKAGKAKITVTSCSNVKVKASVTIKVTTGKSFQPLNRSKWAARMRLPTNKQVAGYRAKQRSPYLTCWPEFPGTSGCYQYAVDFKADSQPRGSYLNVASWWMDVSDLQKRYAYVSADEGYSPGGGYAGFQVLADGRKVAIMSIWKMYVTNSSGKTTALNAKRTYPANPRIAGDFGGEGTGIQTIVDYNWKAGRTYRALVQCGRTDAGNCELEFWVCDLKTGLWTKLVSYDLRYGNTCMTSLGCFSENFLVEHAAEVRTVEWSNFRVDSREQGRWVSAKSAILERQFNAWPGSYSYGSNATCFWAIATGVPNLCTPPANQKRFYVSKAQEGSPF